MAGWTHFVPNLMLMMTWGGPDIGRDPQVMLEKSNDGARIGCQEAAGNGLIGEYRRQAIWLRRDGLPAAYRATITDAVKRTVLARQGKP